MAIAIPAGSGCNEDDVRVLVRMLADTDPDIRLHALHALAGDSAKETSGRPRPADLLSHAIAVLRFDPHKQVRAIAVEVVGRWAHTDRSAAAALTECRDGDAEQSVRKKARSYAPGGAIYRRAARRRAA